MTIRDLFSLAGQHPVIPAVVLLVPPVATWLVGWLHPRERSGQNPWRYVYSVLVYWACIPGMLAGVTTGYLLFFAHESLLDVNIVAYLLPLVSMVVTLLLIGRRVGFAPLPGFDRLSGLMVLLAMSFALALAIEKTRIWLFFGGSVAVLLALAGFAFLLLKWGAYMLFRRSDEPKVEPPVFPKL